MKIHLLTLLLVFFSWASMAQADEAKKAESKSQNAAGELEKPTITKHSVTIDGKVIRYTATVGELRLEKDEDGKAAADIFYVAYTVPGAKPDERPVLFAFNGGPGSSAVWLHLGALGPRIVPTSEDGTVPLAPPHRVVENPQSILDVADLVFIDPVSTGYSRAANKNEASSYHGLEGDIASVSDFIRRYVTENQRWASPKYILGESYGGIRATGVTHYLQQQFGMPINGVVLLSSLLDFRTLSPSQGNDLAYQIFLPAFTALAHFHGKIQGDIEQLLEQSQRFARNGYAQALSQGREIDAAALRETAQQLSALTGIPAALYEQSQLRLSPTRFRRELLREEGFVLGRFDGRVTSPALKNAESSPHSDPSYDVIYGPISSALLDYFSRDLDYQRKPAYRILTGKIHPWKWNSSNGYVNLSDRLAAALGGNPTLRVLVQRGRADLATPADGITYSVRHLVELPDTHYKQIEFADYEAGHMFYLNQPDLEKMRRDLVNFIQAGEKQP